MWVYVTSLVKGRIKTRSAFGTLCEAVIVHTVQMLVVLRCSLVQPHYCSCMLRFFVTVHSASKPLIAFVTSWSLSFKYHAIRIKECPRRIPAADGDCFGRSTWAMLLCSSRLVCTLPVPNNILTICKSFFYRLKVAGL